jgi:hypothetical protein
MGYHIVGKPKTSVASRELVDKFAAMESPPEDRPILERRMMVYRRALADGTFRPVTWATCYCKATGTTYRVNGKHTSLLLSGMTELPELFVTVENYEADTLEDVARLYSTFDARIQLRTTADINRSFSATVPEYSDIHARMINLSVTGISIALWGKTWASRPSAERAELLLDHVDFVVWANSLIGTLTADARKLARGPVVGAMFITWQKSHKDATTFWTAVRDDTGATPGTPDRTLSKYLTTMSVSVGQGSQAPRSRAAPQVEFYAKCIHAWNAWRKNATTDLKYHAAAKLPAAI